MPRSKTFGVSPAALPTKAPSPPASLEADRERYLLLREGMEDSDDATDAEIQEANARIMKETKELVARRDAADAAGEAAERAPSLAAIMAGPAAGTA